MEWVRKGLAKGEKEVAAGGAGIANKGTEGRRLEEVKEDSESKRKADDVHDVVW